MQKTRTKIFKAKKAHKAASYIHKGELVVFPTETVYGIGANAFDEKACKKIFIAKERPQDNPLIVHLYDKMQLTQIAENLPPKTYDLIEAFWPGPLTLVLPKKSTIPNIVTANLNTVAVRQPSHPATLNFLKATKLPIAAPSANRSGKPSPTTYKMAKAAMKGRVSAIINGGECQTGLESTVISWTNLENKKGWTILRPGAVTRDDLLSVLGKDNFNQTSPTKTQQIESPGTQHPHYKPKARVRLFTTKQELLNLVNQEKAKNNLAIIALKNFILNSSLSQITAKTIKTTKQYQTWIELSKHLYSDFFELDRKKTTTIYIQYPLNSKGINEALQNRLNKAKS